MINRIRQKVELPSGTFFGNCFDCKYADWSRRDENGRVLCTVKQGEYERPEERTGCFNYEVIHVEQGKKERVETSEDITSSFGKIIGGIAGLLSVWVVFLFYQTANRMCDGNMDAFDWLNKDAESLGHMLHWGIPLFVLFTCTVSIGLFYFSSYQSKYILMAGSDMMILAIVLKCGRMIWSDWSSRNDNSVVFYRIFGTYSERIGISLFVAIVLLILGFYLKTKEK